MRTWLLTLFILIGTTAVAQPRGSVTIAGYISEIASVRFYSDAPVGPGVRGENVGAQSALNYILDLGDVGVVPGRDNSVRGGEVKLILRANTAYVLSASVATSGFKPGAGELSLRDIGFGVPTAEIAPSGQRARSDGTQVLVAGIDSDPLSAPVTNGEPRYAATLADLQGETPLLRGDRISYGGSLNSASNGLLVSTRYAVHPQYFKANSGFSATVTYTISTP